jgi:hypothetical protein
MERCRFILSRAVLALFFFRAGVNAFASLTAYDAVIAADATAGFTPVARLTNQVVLTGANRAAFDFGPNSGDVTMEFVLEGNPNVGGASAYLAVGANTASNLRYEQFNNTGQLGFTQLGVADYLFSPASPSPVTPTHIAYVWNSATRTMTLYLNGSVAGASSGVSATFAMPTGVGWLGANPNNTETMTGTIYRVTVYDEIIPGSAIQRHADAFNDVVPNIISFSANPAAFLAPGSSTLTWNVQNAASVFINGADVTSASNLVVSPNTTTTYILVASNNAGSSTRAVTVVVNPLPFINSFAANRTYVGAGQTVALSWNVSFGERFFIAPGPGEVTAQTASNGIGSVNVQPSVETLYALTVSNAFGASTASLTIHIVQPADHLVISEFMADNESIIADDDGDFSGWIEIHNPTASPVSLEGYFLTDDDAQPTKWAFPSVELAPDEYLLIFASGKDRTNPAAPLHTNFELNNDGEYLALVGPGPLLVHGFSPAFPSQGEDISYGLLGDDINTARYMGLPTPGEQNSDIAAPPPRPAPVLFSSASGLFTNSFLVTLSAPDSNAVIRFTLNGSTPGLTNGTDYLGHLAITNTTRIRAVAIRSNVASRVSAVSFIRLANDLVGYTSSLPILVIENFGAGTIPQKGWSGTGAGIKQVPRQSAIWSTFDRVAGVSAFTNPPQMFSDVGIRGRGAFSSTWRQKPYSVEAMDAGGGERNVSPLGMPEHPDWVLYFPDPDNNKDPALLFNTFAYELSRLTDHYAVRFRWVEAFINEDGGDLRLADRRGVYAIIEKVSRGENRLNFTRLSETGTNGSWLLNLNRMDPEPETGWPSANGAVQPWFFHTAGPNRILQTPPNASVVGDDEPQQINGFLNFDNPSGYTINTNQRAAIENWFKQFEDVLWDNALWLHPVNGYRKYLDPVDFADYFVLNTLTRNGDGLLISMFPWKGDDGKLRMGPAWDYNWSAYYISGVATGTLLHRPDRLWYKRLFADPDFLQLYIDRWWDMRRGAMSNAGMDAIIDGQMADITPAKALLNGIPTTNDWVTRLTQMKTWLKDRANWIDSNYLRPPTFNTNGGAVPDGFQIIILGTNGTIYFTTDGTDPRASGGAIAGTAASYQAPFAVYAQTQVKARVKNGTNWSGLTAAVFYTPQDLSTLVLTEIMYNPPPFGGWGSDDLEFLEFKNTGTNVLNLGGLAFVSGIDFVFTNGTLLGAGQFFVIARNPAVMQSRYPGLTVNGVYTGRLDNGGEALRIATALSNVVLAVTYDDRTPWPLAPDGWGFSLVPRQQFAGDNSDDGVHWRASAAAGGSPGADDPEPSFAPIVINEVLAHTDLPDVDAVELFNSTAQQVNIGGWFLSDDGTVPKKFRIPDDTTIEPGSYVIFTEADFNPVPGTLFNFSLDSAGDSLYLTSGNASSNLTGYSHGLAFGASATSVSFGRYINSVGEEQFPAQLASTLGAANVGPSVGPVVISEIMYHPEAGGDEFVELRNITSGDVSLFDPAHLTNTWRVNGLGFTFPTNVVLPSNGIALIVATNPSAFRARYSVPPEVLVLGPMTGVLQDSGERLELQRPEPEDASSATFITVDEVRYNDKLPWPPDADGGGPSLQRRMPNLYGNDPVNWRAAAPTPGIDFVPGNEPFITGQPQNVTVMIYHDAMLSLSVTGAAPLYYQWFFNGDPMPGQTNAVLALPYVQPAQAGVYHVIVFNTAGSVTSVGAQLHVLAPVVINQHPQSITTNAGRIVIFNVSATSTNALRYQWLSNGISLTNSTNASLGMTNVQAPNEGFYSVVISGTFGAVTSRTAQLVLLYDPFIIQQPVSQTVPTGGTFTISIAVTNNATLPLGYRLRRNGVTLAETFFSTDQRTAFYTITNAQPPFTLYGVSVTNAARPTGIPSLSATITLVRDGDGDGAPDFWETQYGFNTNSASDGVLDADNDGMLNWEEWVAGTDPTNAASYLKLEMPVVNAGATLAFGAIAARTYTLEFTDGLGSGMWLPLTNFVARSNNYTATVFDPNYVTNRFYRVVTPRRP